MNGPYAAYLTWSEVAQHAEAEQKKKEDEVAERERESNQKLEEDREKKEIQSRKADRKGRFYSAAAELKLALDYFCRINTDFKESLVDAAVCDKRKDWKSNQSLEH